MSDQAPRRETQILEIIVIATVTGSIIPAAVYALVQQTEHASENNLYIAAACSITLLIGAIVALVRLLTRPYRR